MPRSDNASRDRKQFAVCWKASGRDDYGEVTVDPAVELKVRIEKGIFDSLGIGDVLEPQRNAISSTMLINVPEEVPVGSLLWIGKLKNLPSPVPEVLQVIDYEEVPDLKGRKFDRNVKVMRHGNKDPVLT